MNRQRLISVVVPIYNTKNELHRCIESLLKQTYPTLEILLIDDGSTDGSAELCNEYAKKDARIKVIHQKNSGVVAARNAGILAANGEYVSFVDSDDYIDANTYEELTRVVDAEQADILTFSWIREYATVDGNRVSGKPECDGFDEGIYDDSNRREFLENLMCLNGYAQVGILPSLCTKLIRRELLLTNIERISKKITYGEDACLIYMCAMDANKIVVSHRVFYHYCMRETSCVHHADKKCFLGLNEIYECLSKKIMEKSEYQEVLVAQLERFIAKTAIQCLQNRFGFSNGGVLPQYTIALKELQSNTKLVLYGAGRVGTSYYKQIKGLGQANIVLWVDKDPGQTARRPEVSTLQALYATEFDYILIAVKNKAVMSEIEEELMEMGIPKEKILWEEPKFILDVYN